MVDTATIASAGNSLRDRDILVGSAICILAVLGLVQSWFGVTQPAEMIELYGVSEYTTEGGMVITSSGGLVVGFATIIATVYWRLAREGFTARYYLLMTLLAALGTVGAVCLPFLPMLFIVGPLLFVELSWTAVVEALFAFRRWVRKKEQALFERL